MNGELETAKAEIERLLGSPGLRMEMSHGGTPQPQVLEFEQHVLIHRHTLRVIIAELQGIPTACVITTE